MPVVFRRFGECGNGTMAIVLDDQGLNHWRGAIWNPGFVGQQCLHVCYDYLCLMTLFLEVMLLLHDWAEWAFWTGTGTSITPPCDVDRLSHQNAWQIKELKVVVMTDGYDNISLQRCACGCGTSLGVLSAGRIPIVVIRQIGCGPVGRSDWLRVCGAVVAWPGGVRIGYIRRVSIESSSTAAAPVTGSLVFSTPLDCLDVYCAAEFSSCLLFGGTDCVWLAGFGLFFGQVSMNCIMATDGAALVEGRAGITFGVELYIPWDALEAVVDIHSAGVVALGSITDVIGLTGRRPDAAESRVLQGRDVRSVRVLVPDLRGLDQNFHDVTIVDMGESLVSLQELSLSVSLQEVSLLRQQWPPVVLRHMVWLQQELEAMCADAKKRFRQTKPNSCVYCSTWIKCDLYRHVANFHLDLVQLWRFPVSWCTVWKGTPQDCMDHVREAHDVPWVVKSAWMDQFIPPWTVRRQVWSDSLKQSHSGISTDVLLFSDINLSLVHHYRVHKHGLPHVAFRKDYMARL